jgi:hypothetical protein
LVKNICNLNLVGYPFERVETAFNIITNKVKVSSNMACLFRCFGLVDIAMAAALKNRGWKTKNVFMKLVVGSSKEELYIKE